MVNSDRSSFDGEGDVVSRFIGGIPVGGLCTSAIVMAIFANTVNYVAFDKTIIPQQQAVEGINWHGGKKLRRELIQIFRQSSVGQTETFNSNMSGLFPCLLGGQLSDIPKSGKCCLQKSLRWKKRVLTLI